MNKSFESLLLEALSPEQMAYTDNLKKSADHQKETIEKTKSLSAWVSDRDNDPKYLGHDQHDNLFEKHTGYASSERLISPIGSDSKVEPHPKVRTWLESNGFSTDKYSDKTTSRMETNSRGEMKERTYRIGALLQKHAPKHVMKAFETDPAIASSNNSHQMVVTRNAYDIGGMTSGRHWVCTSCMRLPGMDASFPEKLEKSAEDGGYDVNHYRDNGGAYHHKIKGDFLHGSMVGYFTKKGDDTAENPVARTIFKKMVGKNSEGESHVVFRPEETLYGDKSSKFTEHAKKFAEENWPAKPGFKYNMPTDLYQDSSINFTHHADGEITHVNGVTANYKNGVTHSPDNDTPAIKYGGPYSDTEEFHKDGKRHRDGDKPAQITKKKNGDVSEEEYYQNGMRHRDGDKPSVISNMDAFVDHNYHKYGLMHRDGDAPSHVIFDKSNNTPIKEYYHKFGVLHRDGGLPAVIDHVSGSEEYHVHGELHRDGDLPAITNHSRGWRTSTEQMWYKNGISTREDGKPVRVVKETNDDGFKLEETFKKKNGTSGSDKGDHYPYWTKTSVSNHHTSIQHNYLDNGELHISKSDKEGERLDNVTYTKNSPDTILVGHDHIQNKSEIHYSKVNRENNNVDRHIFNIDHDKGTVNYKETYGSNGQEYDLNNLSDKHKSLIKEGLDLVNDHIGLKDDLNKRIFGDKK